MQDDEFSGSVAERYKEICNAIASMKQEIASLPTEDPGLAKLQASLSANLSVIESAAHAEYNELSAFKQMLLDRASNTIFETHSLYGNTTSFFET